MTDHLARALPHRVRSHRWGKLLVILLFGAFAGSAYHRDARARIALAATLPAERDAVSCPIYPAKLTATENSAGFDVTLFIVMVGVFFGLYELAGRIAGAAVSRVLPLGAPGAGSDLP